MLSNTLCPMRLQPTHLEGQPGGGLLTRVYVMAHLLDDRRRKHRTAPKAARLGLEVGHVRTHSCQR